MTIQQRRRRAIRILASACAIVPTLLSGADRFICTFADKNGKPLNGVESRLVAIDQDDLVGMEPLYRKSGDDGIVEYPQLLPGKYIFEAQLKGYIPMKRVVAAGVDTSLQRTFLKTGEFERLERKALKEMDAGRFEDAVEGLETLVGHYPEDAVLHDALARAYAGLHDLEKALAAARLAQEHNPERFPDSEKAIQRTILQRQGEEALQAYEFEAAEAVFRELREIAPEEPIAYEGLAIACGHQGKLDEAMEAIKRAIELDPDNPKLKEIRGVLENAVGGG